MGAMIARTFFFFNCQLAEALSVSAERERLIATLQMSISTTLSEEKAAREGLKTEIQTLKVRRLYRKGLLPPISAV